jgi:hypothetical protein
MSAKDIATPTPSESWLRYPARAIATFAAAIIVGPLVGIVIAIAADMLVGLLSTEPSNVGRFPEALLGLVVPGYMLGAPIAAVAGLIAAVHVAHSGRISPLRTALIAFLTPVVPLVILGGPVGILFGLLYGIPAAGAAIIVRQAGIFVWQKLYRGAA